MQASPRTRDITRVFRSQLSSTLAVGITSTPEVSGKGVEVPLLWTWLCQVVQLSGKLFDGEKVQEALEQAINSLQAASDGEAWVARPSLVLLGEV